MPKNQSVQKWTIYLLILVIIFLLIVLIGWNSQSQMAREHQLQSLQGTEAALIQTLARLETLAARNPPPGIGDEGDGFLVTIPVP